MNRRYVLKILISTLGGTALPKHASAAIKLLSGSLTENHHESYIRDYLFKLDHFDENHTNDLFLGNETLPVLESTLRRLERLQNFVGYANFGLLSIDQALYYARSYPSIGGFTKTETLFLESLFYRDGALYGFHGEKPVQQFSNAIKKQDTIKIPGTGHYLYKGDSAETYKKIKRHVGEDMVLTSGLRGVIKQFYLFLTKVYNHKGNLSLASRSLAPPGYSLHGIGDFDVGQKGYGKANFTWSFTNTQVYHRLKNSGFADFRYQQHNRLGVRFEPWHIKVA